MADNINVNEATTGTLRAIASDLIGGVDYPRFKAGFGVEGAYTDVSATDPLPTKAVPVTSGGLTNYTNISLLATGINIKSTPGQVYEMLLSNLHSTNLRYVKLYNKATAPTVGTDTPFRTIPLKPGETLPVAIVQGLEFSNGIGIGATTGIGLADTSAPGANEVVVNMGFK